MLAGVGARETARDKTSAEREFVLAGGGANSRSKRESSAEKAGPSGIKDAAARRHSAMQVRVERSMSAKERARKPDYARFESVTVHLNRGFQTTLAGLKRQLGAAFAGIDAEIATPEQCLAYYIQANDCTTRECVCRSKSKYRSTWLGSGHVVDGSGVMRLQDPALDEQTLAELGFIPGDHGLLCQLMSVAGVLDDMIAAEPKRVAAPRASGAAAAGAPRRERKRARAAEDAATAAARAAEDAETAAARAAADAATVAARAAFDSPPTRIVID